MENEETDLPTSEIMAKQRSHRLFLELTSWLIRANIDYQVETWSSAEGKDIIVKDARIENSVVKFSFSEGGLISIEAEDKTDGK